MKDNIIEMPGVEVFYLFILYKISDTRSDFSLNVIEYSLEDDLRICDINDD